MQSNSEEESLIPKDEDGEEGAIQIVEGGENKSSIAGASMNFINSIIGSGIIGKAFL